MTNTPDARKIALDLLEEILEKGELSHIALKRTLTKYQDLSKLDRAFITRLVEGTIEHKITLDYFIDSYSKTKVRKMKPIIRTILRMSVYQLKYMTQVPVSAVCNEAVKLTKKRGFHGLSGFVNGVLRGMVRNNCEVVLPDCNKNPIGYLSITYSMPEWIIREFLSQYDFATVEGILQSFIEVRPTSIRCNTANIDVTNLREKLLKEGVTVENGDYLEESLKISGYDHLNELDSFRSGDFQVQDPASMLPARCAGIKKNDLVIDVCAAPGGKSLHAACILKEQESVMNLTEKKGFVISRDLTEKKVALIIENQKRLKVDNLIAEVHDATKFDSTYINKADVVIADLPCSGLGVIGKKPDIKYNIQEESLVQLADLQKQILNVIHKYVKVGGTLLYSTCTLNPRENEENVKYIVENLGFELESLDPYLPKTLQCDTTSKGYLTLIPGVHHTDGFFIARLKRKA